MGSRRRFLATFATGIGLGAVGGYVTGKHPFTSDPESVPPPVTMSASPDEWPFLDYDRGHTRNPPPASAPSGDLNVQWRYSLKHDHSVNVPVVGNDQVLLPVVDEEKAIVTIRSFSLTSGESIWEWQAPTSPSSRTSLAVVGDSVFCHGSFSGGQSVRLDAATGAKVWDTTEGSLAHVTAAAGYLITTLRIENDSIVRALDGRTGEVAWESKRMDFPVTDATAAVGNRLVVASGARLVGLDARTGEHRWQISVPAPLQWGPVLADEQVFTGTSDGSLAAYDATSGKRLWRRKPTGPVDCGDGRRCSRRFGSGAVSTDVFVTVEERFDSAPDVLHARDLTDGALLWKTEPTLAGDVRLSPPIIAGNTVYIGEQTDEQGCIVGYDLSTGDRTTKRALDGQVYQIQLIDGRVLALTRDELLILR